MNVLCQGAPFCTAHMLLDLYEGRHDIRLIGIDEEAQCRFDPLRDTMNDIVERLGPTWRPDLFLCWTPEIYPPPLRIEDSPIPTVAMVSDWHIYYPVLAKNLARFDVVLCDKAGVKVLENAWVAPQHLFPLYSQVSTLHKPHAVPRDLDVVYAGSLNAATHHRRAQYLERLARLAGRYNIEIVSGVMGDDYARLLSRAKTVFNCTLRGELNLRVFETLACGAVPFVEEENLEHRLEQVLKRLDEATAIAARAQNRAAGFAGENRLDALIEWAAEQHSGGRPFRQFPPDERTYQDLLLFGLSRWPVYAPLGELLVLRLTKTLPKDPRVWTALARFLLGHEEGQDAERSTKAFLQAHRLNRASAPYALNAATACRARGLQDLEAEYLDAVLHAETLDGAELVVGNPECPFWIRWGRAVATKTAALDMLRAEARIRLATILARRGQAPLAEEHLARAALEDPDNYKGVELCAEILWNTERKAEAADMLAKNLVNLPLNMRARNRLREMLEALGRNDAAHALAEEANTIARAYRAK